MVAHTYDASTWGVGVGGLGGSGSNVSLTYSVGAGA